MATYFKYAEREADSQVNWAEIGKNMSDMLKEEVRIREEKKAAIDKASRDYGVELANAPQGEHKGMNQWALEYGADASQARLMQDKLLKSGQLKLKDYVVMRQNLTDGTEAAFSLMDEYQTEYQKKMERMKAGQSQDLETWLMAEAEGFSNFSNTKLYINPTDYTLNVGKMVVGEDGVRKMSDNPNDFATINSMRNRIKSSFDKFDVAANVSKFVSGLGEEIETMTELKNKYQRGTITEFLDITDRTNFGEDEGSIQKFEDAERKMINSMLVVDYDVSSILTNNVDFESETGNEYTYTWDEKAAKKNPNLILLKTDPNTDLPVPVFEGANGAKQRQAAFDYLKTQARLMYDKTEKVTVIGASERQQEAQWQFMERANRQTKETVFQSWQDLYTGDDARVQAATDAILGLPEMKEEGLISISRGKYIDPNTGKDAYGVTFKYADPNKNRSIPFTDANLTVKTPDDWFKSGTEVFGKITDSDLNRFGKGSFGTADYEKSIQSKRDYNATPSTAPDTGYDQYVYTEGYIGEDSPDKTVAHLSDKFNKFGFTFQGRSNYGSDYVTVIPKVGEPKEFNIDNQEQLGELQKYLINNGVNKESVSGVGGSWNGN